MENFSYSLREMLGVRRFTAPKSEGNARAETREESMRENNDTASQ